MSNEDNLIRTFDLVYGSAIAAQNAGQYKKAKRDYYKAAEIMTDLAKLSDNKLKAARVDRAKRIIEIADGLPEISVCIPKNVAGKGSSADADEECAIKPAEIPSVTFDDVIGLDQAKEAIRIKMIYPMTHGDMYEALGKKAGGGILLYGPPGTGKTLLARAAAHEAGATFYAVKCSDIMSKWVGESERNIAALFDRARSDGRAIIFFDELDSLFFKRGTDVHNDRRVNELLQQIDGFAGNDPGLMVLGATNNPWAVDDAAMRPGRFSQKIYIPLPDVQARKLIVEQKLGIAPIDGVLDTLAIAQRADGYSGADIAELIDRATDYPLRRSLDRGELCGLTIKDVEIAFRYVKPSVDADTVKKFEKFDSGHVLT